MKKDTMILNMFLAVVLGFGLLIGLLWSVFCPNVVLSELDLPAMAALILIALLLEYFVAGTPKRAWIVQVLLAAVTFALLPWAAGLECAGIKVTVCGTAAFAVLTWMFDFAAERIELTVDRKSAMVPTAFVMYLACQCLMGMIL